MAPMKKNPSDIPPEDPQALEAWLMDFDRSWNEDRLAAHVDELPPLPNRMRRDALNEMVKIDLRRRWQRGTPVNLETYLQTYPELGTPESVSPDLIHAEYEARRQSGAPAGWSDIERRFPRQAEEVRRLAQSADTFATANALATTEPEVGPACRAGPGNEVPPGRRDLPAELPEHFGRYRILKKLGQGGMGSVYLAHDRELDREVALKVPRFTRSEDPEILERFYREARAAAMLHHPNICPVHDVGEINGIRYLTMAYIDGKPLSAFARDAKTLPQRPVAAIVRKLAVALDEAHRKGVIHRDLKPANIMMNERKEPVIMDFGLARRIRQEDVRLTRTGAILGTPAYMSPEQVSGDLEAMGPASDIYSLGVILYELLTGRLPFQGSMAAVLGQVATQEPEPPSRYRADLDPALEKICLKAMAKKAEARYASMGEFAEALGGYLRAARPAAGPSPTVLEATPTAGGPARPEDDSQLARFYSELAAQFYAGLVAQHGATAGPAGTVRPAGPARMPRWPWIAATLLLLGGIVVLAYIALNRPTARETTVVVHLHLDGIPVGDPTAVIYLDGEPISAEKLTGPLQLKTGPHEVRVQRDGHEETRTFNVGREDNDGTVRVPPAAEVARTDEAPGGDLPADLKGLVEALGDTEPAVRKHAAESLRALRDRRAVPALVKRVGDDVWLSNAIGPSDPAAGGKAAALDALKELAPDRVTEALVPALQSRVPQVRRWAALELGKQKDRAAVPALVKRVGDEVWLANPVGTGDPEGGGKTAALKALRELAPEQVVEALLPALQSNVGAMRVWAAVELGRHGDKAAVPALMKRVADDVWLRNPVGSSDPQAGGKADALKALKTLAPEKASEALREAMKSKNQHVRSWAAAELGRLRETK